MLAVQIVISDEDKARAREKTTASVALPRHGKPSLGVELFDCVLVRMHLEGTTCGDERGKDLDERAENALCADIDSKQQLRLYRLLNPVGHERADDYVMCVELGGREVRRLALFIGSTTGETRE